MECAIESMIWYAIAIRVRCRRFSFLEEPHPWCPTEIPCSPLPFPLLVLLYPLSPPATTEPLSHLVITLLPPTTPHPTPPLPPPLPPLPAMFLSPSLPDTVPRQHRHHSPIRSLSFNPLGSLSNNTIGCLALTYQNRTRFRMLILVRCER